MYSKSQVAFELSCQKFFEENRHVYFWTFTIIGLYPDWYYSSIWEKLNRDLQDIWGGSLSGLKVVELHERKGIHWHCLLNQRLWVEQVRRIGKRYGIGRVHVKKADIGAIKYLTKYVKKQFAKENPLYSGCSRWGTVGTFSGVQVKNIEVEGPYQRAIKLCQEETGIKKFPYTFCLLLAEHCHDEPEVIKTAARNFIRQGSISNLWGHKLPHTKPQREKHLKALKK